MPIAPRSTFLTNNWVSNIIKPLLTAEGWNSKRIADGLQKNKFALLIFVAILLLSHPFWGFGFYEKEPSFAVERFHKPPITLPVSCNYTNLPFPWYTVSLSLSIAPPNPSPLFLCSSSSCLNHDPFFPKIPFKTSPCFTLLSPHLYRSPPPSKTTLEGPPPPQPL